MKTALIHDFLFEYAGSERVVEQILKVYPQADLFSVVDFLREDQRSFLQQKHARTTFVEKLPLLRQNPARFLPYVVPLMALAVEQIDLRGYDRVISSSHSVAKGVLTGPDQPHIAYIHSPMRFAWDLQADYLQSGGMRAGPLNAAARLMLSLMRVWDARTANGVDHFIANSRFIARRIWKTYRREAEVIYPPVDVDRFPILEQKDDYYLVVSRFVPYKRVDLIAEAFRSMTQRRLVVVGSGPERKRIQAVSGLNVELVGFQPVEKLVPLVRHARALVIAAEEDFGITPVEAQAAGTPVIAFGRGGAAETVCGLDQARPTGVFFPEQDPASLVAAVETFERERRQISPQDCRANALRFSPERFRDEFKASIEMHSINVDKDQQEKIRTFGWQSREPRSQSKSTETSTQDFRELSTNTEAGLHSREERSAL